MLKFLILISLWNCFGSEVVPDSIESLYQVKNFQTIVQDFGAKVLELDRSDQFLVAQAYFNLGNKKMAIKVFELMIERHPKDAPARRKLAEIYRQEKKYKEAIENLKLAIEANPKYEQAYFELASVILEFKPRNFLEARMVYEDMVQKFGSKIEYLRHVCDLSVKEGQHIAAEKACKQALQLLPDDTVSLISSGLILRDKREFDKSDEYFSKLMTKYTDNPVILVASGDYFKERKLLSKAFEAYEKAAQSDSAEYAHILKAAILACELQFQDKCYQFFEKACSFGMQTKADLRQSMNVIKGLNDKQWMARFEQLAMSCDTKKLE